MFKDDESDGYQKKLVSYIDTVGDLSSYPILHYLSSFILTVNAFCLYAQRSLALVETPVEEVKIVETDPVEVTPE